jgi:hypothetical protein
LPFPSSSNRALQPFDLVYCDLWTSLVPSVSGYKYYLVILDDFTHYSWTFPLRQKSNTFPTLSHFFAFVSTQFGRTIRSVQCDNGREIDNSSTSTFFLSHDIQLRMSCPYTSPQNGKAERMIRTTNDVMRSMLFQASLPARYWTESFYTATYILNLLPTRATSAPTPYFAFFDTTPSYTHLRVFRCACYPNTSATAPHKLASHSCRCIFLGYSSNHKRYRCLDLTTNRLLISRHVIFDESSFSFPASDPPPIDLDSLFSSSPTVQAIAPPYCSSIAGTSKTVAMPRAAPVSTLVPRAAPVPPPVPRAAPTTAPRVAPTSPSNGISSCTVCLCGPLHDGYQDNILD